MNYKQWLLILLKYVIGGVIFYLVYRKFNHFDFSGVKAIFQPGMILLLISIKMFCFILATMRWHLVLKKMGFSEKFSKVVELSIIGVGMNYVTPGSVSGDLIKGALLEKRSRSLRKVSLSLLLDRVSGLFSLMIMLCASFVALYFFKPDVFVRVGALIAGERILMVLGVVGLLVAAVVGLALLNQKVKGLCFHLWQDLQMLKGQWFNILFLSFLSQFMQIVFLFAIALRIGADDISLLSLIFIYAFANMALTVPITPGGFGVGQALYTFLLGIYLGYPTNTGVILFSCYQIFDMSLVLPGVLCLGRVFLRGDLKKVEGLAGNAP